MTSTGLSSNLPMLPILIPFISAIFMLFFSRRVKLHRVVAGIAATANLAVAIFLLLTVRSQGMLVFCASGWSPPFGIILNMDLFFLHHGDAFRDHAFQWNHFQLLHH